MARDYTDAELRRLEAEVGREMSSWNNAASLGTPGGVPADYRLAAEQLGLHSPGMGQPISLRMIENLRAACERHRQTANGTSVLDAWKKDRPKSARYMRPKCRATPDGGGGAPLQRPTSAPSGRHRAKTERWRESGMTRWPKESDKIHHTSDPSDGDPLRRGCPKQPDWTGELWTRSLRRPGVEIQDAAYYDVAQRGMRELHEEWQEPAPSPRRPLSARAGYSPRGLVPYSGSTAIGRAALPRRYNPREWVERPVATGKMSLNHFDGQRYKFSQEGRGLEWDEYLRMVNTTNV